MIDKNAFYYYKLETHFDNFGLIAAEIVLDDEGDLMYKHEVMGCFEDYEYTIRYLHEEIERLKNQLAVTP